MKRIFATSLVALALLAGTGLSTAAHADDRRSSHDYSQNRHDYNSNYSRYGHSESREREQSRAVYYYGPPANYHPHTQKTKVVYVYPSRSYYPRSYVQTYSIGGYLPRDRYWYPLPTYVAQDLPRPGFGQRWVYADRDAVLISEATSRIISGVLLAASID